MNSLEWTRALPLLLPRATRLANGMHSRMLTVSSITGIDFVLRDMSLTLTSVGLSNDSTRDDDL